ncbi:MAG: hypothetical protein CBR30_01470 [Dictyoglomus sp. NZ13-RE01]|nr:MAG: hypothetical protein CBR30_01470 [Dictyoglomus sp. NZ13-RE01]
MRIFCIFVLFLILFVVSFSQEIPIIRVGVLKIDREIFISNVGLIVNSYINIELGGNGELYLKISENCAVLNFGKDVLILSLPITLYPQKDKKITINSNQYRGIFEINNDGWLINILNLEEYLYGVVPAEMPASYPIEALKAQAVASRTYALANMGKHKDFDLCSTTHCQVYKGFSYEKESSNKAVLETIGEVITYNGSLIKAFFHSSSGGITENSEDVWGGYYPYLRSVKDVEELEKDSWTVYYSFEDTRRKLLSININLENIDTIELEKSATGRVKNVVLKNTMGENIIKGTLWREIFDLPSTLFNIEFSNGGMYFKGKGYGHGVGMSQKGAKYLAEKGYNYKDILKYYYQGVDIKRWY